MMELQLEMGTIAEVVNGDIIAGNPEDKFKGVATNTRVDEMNLQRTVSEGSLFIPLKGERFDGHQFIDIAIDMGAIGVIVDRDTEITNKSIFVLLVEDTTNALMDIAKYMREGYQTTLFIGITGTSGKTTTKDIIYDILKDKFKVYKTKMTTNNEFGVPLNILNMDGDEEYAVIEVGTNRPGEIEMHSEILKPQVAIATNVGMGHIEFFESLDHIAREKESMFVNLPEDGFAILNADDEYVRNFNSPAEKYLYGIENKADMNVDKWEDLNTKGMEFTIEGCEFTTPLCGKHNLLNILASLSCARILGLELVECIEFVSRLTPTSARMEIIQVEGVIVINDAYNANPLSMESVLEWFTRNPDFERRYLVLGDMLELGDLSEKAHRELGERVGRYISCQLVAKVYYIGEYASYFCKGYLKSKGDTNGCSVLKERDKMELIEIIKEDLDEGDGILFKASNSIGLSNLAVDFINELNMDGREE